MYKMRYTSDDAYEHIFRRTSEGDSSARDNASTEFYNSEGDSSADRSHTPPPLLPGSNDPMLSLDQCMANNEGDVLLDFSGGQTDHSQSSVNNSTRTLADQSSQVPPSMEHAEPTSHDFPSFDEMANQGQLLQFDKEFNFANALNEYTQANSQQYSTQSNYTDDANSTVSQDISNTMLQNLAFGPRLPDNTGMNQASINHAALWTPTNLNTVICPTRNYITQYPQANSALHLQGVIGPKITSDASHGFDYQDHYSENNTYTRAPSWDYIHSHARVPQWLPPPLRTRVGPTPFRNRTRHRLGAILPGRAVSSLAPNAGHPANEVYNSRPLVAPSVSSTNVARINRRYKPSLQYLPLPLPPRPWNVFRYNQYGELDPAQLYTAGEVMTYLFNHPLHSGHNPKISPLQVLVQRNAPSARHRYPTVYSNRCRFSNCPHPTINQGHTRVAFNESSITTANQDPFILAAYVHLWCLERFCDLPRIISELNFSADHRRLHLEWKQRNPMRLALTHEKAKDVSCEEIVLDSFIQSCRNRTLDPKYPRYDQENRPHEGTLTYQLAAEKLKREPKSITRQREKRIRLAGYEGSTLTTHLGDLELEATKRKSTRMHQNQNQQAKRPLRKRKFNDEGRIRDDSDDEEDEDEESAEETTSGDEKGPPAEASGRTPAPVAQMTAQCLQRSATGTKRPREDGDEAPYFLKRRTTASGHPLPFLPPTPPLSDRLSGPPSRAFSDSPAESSHSTFPMSPRANHYLFDGPPRSNPYVQSAVGDLSHIKEQSTKDEDKETKIRRLKQQLQMLEAQESGKGKGRESSGAMDGVEDERQPGRSRGETL